MATGNPYYVEPLGGLDVGAKLTQVLEGGRQVARRKEWEDTAAGVIQSGDPNAISQLMIKYPEMTDTIQKAIGLSPKSMTNLQGIAQQILVTGEAPPEALMAQIQAASQSNENPAIATKMLKQIAEGDMAGLKKTAELYTAMVAPKVYESYSKATAGPKADLTASQKEYEMAVLQGYKGSFMDYQKELKAAGKSVSTTTVTNVLGDKVVEEIGKEQASTLVKSQETVQGSVNSLKNMQEMATLLDQGIISGTGAGFLTSVGNALSSRLGINFAEDAVANTQAYAAAAGRQVAEVIKAFGSGTGLSDQDRAYAEGIAGGKIEFNEKALRKLIRLNEKYTREGIKSHNKKARQAEERVKKGGGQILYDLTVEEPPVINLGGDTKSGAVPPTVTTQDQYDDLPSGAIYIEDGVKYRKP